MTDSEAAEMLSDMDHGQLFEMMGEFSSLDVSRWITEAANSADWLIIKNYLEGE